MKFQIVITLSDRFSDSNLHDFDRLKISNYSTIVKRFSAERQTGGLIWGGIVFFISEKIAEGFLTAIGQKGYTWIVNTLFKKKNMLRPKNIERFTFNIPFNNGMQFFDFTNITSEDDFVKAIKSAKLAYDENIEKLKHDGGYYDFTYDASIKKWLVTRNKSFDI